MFPVWELFGHGWCGNGGFGGNGGQLPLTPSQRGKDTVLLCDVEQGSGRYARTARLDAVGVLPVGFGVVVACIEAAEAMEIVAAIFAQGFDEGKADVEPVLVTSSDVGARGFDLFDKCLDVGGEVIGGRDRRFREGVD